MPRSSGCVIPFLAWWAIACCVLTAGVNVYGIIRHTGERQQLHALSAGVMAVCIGLFSLELRRQKRIARREEKHRRALMVVAYPRLLELKRENDPAPAAARTEDGLPILASGEPVLAHWSYTEAEWAPYAASAGEGGGCAQALVLMIGAIVGGFFVFQGAWGLWELAVTGAVALFIGVTAVALQMFAERHPGFGPAEVVITPTAVLLNARYHVLSDHRIRLEGVRYETWPGRPSMLAFDLARSTGFGGRYPPLRIPVPPGREAEAQALAQKLVRARQAMAAAAAGAGPRRK